MRLHANAPAVFVERKKTAGDIAWILRKRGFKAEAIHGNRSQAEREKALHAFRSGEADVLVATSVAARGIHIDGVAHVINYELPPTIEEYIHRIGRTGRAGAVGVATSFFRPRNAAMAPKLLEVLSLTGAPALQTCVASGTSTHSPQVRRSRRNSSDTSNTCSPANKLCI